MNDAVAAAKQHLRKAGLLAGVPDDTVVPDLILRSWRRSIGNSAEGSLPAQRFQDIDTDSILRRAADPVLDRWHDQLTDTGTTLFLSDRAGSIVARRISDRSVRRKLDRVNAVEGFDYSEDAIGTNGLGTSMIEGRGVYIEGSQHFNESLSVLACAAVPVFTPAGLVIGSVSLGGPLASASPLMLTLTKEIGKQIEERLTSATRPQDLALAMTFMRYANSRRPTVILDRESLLANTPGLPYISVDTHAMLWDRLHSHDWSADATARIDLDDGAIGVTARRVVEGARSFFVLHFASAPTVGAVDSIDPGIAVPGRIARTSADAVSVAVVEGPSGSGRATRATDLHSRLRGRRQLDVVTLDAETATPWNAVGDLLSGGHDVLIRRLEILDDADASRLSSIVTAHLGSTPGAGGSMLLATVSFASASPLIREMAEGWGVRERIVPLSQDPGRIPGLVRAILDRVDTRSRHSMSPAALQSLMQWHWPGDVAELVEVVTSVAARSPVSIIERSHLPEHIRTASAGRPLSLMETAEKEAILEALTRTEGNKSLAAELLGIGRTTLYRRIRQLGLDRGESSL
ncbi:sigma-54-dependent Fis family transcriptional regulator [Rhodococcoides corynebacterioides]|uniref:sigma-54-dependent Fis family transcriptional regulator n=1 Tax=Rhodococcoides corynebacterioides TaxID=53972 RepID=UPI003ADF4BE1